MADGRHIENRLLAISQRIITRLTRNFVGLAESRSNTGSMTKIPNFENSRWRTAAILKIVLSLYLSRKSSDFNEIWYADADYDSKVGYLTKYQNFSNSKWRTDRFSRFDTISAVTDTQPPRHVAVASTRYYAYLRRAVKMQLACVFLCGWSKMVEPRVTKFGDMLTLRRSVVRLILDSKGQWLRSDNLKVSACLTMPVASPNFISIHKMASSYAVDCYS